MAERKVETTDSKYGTVSWTGLTGTENGGEVAISQFPDKTVQINGTLDGGTITLQGSMDGTNWETLTVDGAFEINTTGIFFVWENPFFIRPRLSGGGVSSDIDVVLGFSTLIG